MTKRKVIGVEKKQEKVLLLSLGVGRLDETHNGGYRPAEYAYLNKEITTEFVAEPLLDSYQPDTLVIIGTSKSKWDMFFDWFSQKMPELHLSNKNIRNTLKQWEGHEISMSMSELNGLSLKLSDDLAPLAGTPCFSTVKKICAIVIRYGINDEELEENYSILSDRLSCVFTQDKEYDVAFDITHSFRSMPIYNLIVIQYLDSVSPYTLNISHVYYGMLDVIRELGHAPVVDLGRLTDTLKLSQAVEEFHHTGSVLAITRLLTDDNDKDLKLALEKLSWAMECNSMSGFDKSMRNLLRVLKAPAVSAGRYADIRTMLTYVLSACFSLDTNDAAGSWERLAKGDMLPAKKQILLAKWYLHVNLCGKACLVAQEALRTILYSIWAAGRNTGINMEKERRNAVNNLKSAVSILTAEKLRTPAGDMLIQLENDRQNTVELRNGYAHNLDIEIDTKIAREKADRFIADLEAAVQMMETEDGRQKLIKAYNAKPAAPAVIKTDREKPNRLILFGDDQELEDKVCARYVKSNKTSYNVYYFSKPFTNMLRSSTDVDGCAALLKTAFDSAGIELSLFQEVILWRTKPGEAMRIAAALSRLNCGRLLIAPPEAIHDFLFSPMSSFKSSSESNGCQPVGVIPEGWIEQYTPTSV